MPTLYLRAGDREGDRAGGGVKVAAVSHTMVDEMLFFSN